MNAHAFAKEIVSSFGQSAATFSMFNATKAGIGRYTSEEIARRVATALTVLTALGLSFKFREGRKQIALSTALLSLPAAEAVYADAKAGLNWARSFSFIPVY